MQFLLWCELKAGERHYSFLVIYRRELPGLICSQPLQPALALQEHLQRQGKGRPPDETVSPARVYPASSITLVLALVFRGRPPHGRALGHNSRAGMSALCKRVPKLKALQPETSWLGEQSAFCRLEPTPPTLLSLWGSARAARAGSAPEKTLPGAGAAPGEHRGAGAGCARRALGCLSLAKR